MDRMFRLACAAALLALGAGVETAKAGPIEMLRWEGGTFVNESRGPANDFDVRVRFRSPTTFSGPIFKGSTGPFDATTWNKEGGDNPYFTAIYKFDKSGFVNWGASITLGGFHFQGTHADVLGVDMFWTLDGNRVGDYIQGGKITQVPEPASLALLGAGLLGLGLLRRRARPQPAGALDEGGDLGHAQAGA